MTPFQVFGMAAVLALAADAPPLSTMRPEAIRAHVAFLADDALEGRGIGTRGYEQAASYVAAQMAAAGLAAAADGGTFLQPVPMRRATLKPSESSAVVVAGGSRRSLTLGEEVVLLPDALRPQVQVSAPCVLVGFGITAPSMGHDDYAGLDVRGRAVVLLSGAPGRLSPEARAFHGNPEELARNAAEHGAVALLRIHVSGDPRFSWERLVRFASRPRVRWVAADGRVQHGRPELRALASVRGSAAEALFAGSRRTLHDVLADAGRGRAPAFALASSVEIVTSSAHETLASPNVVGRLPGADPGRAGEYVVVTAHLDHLGTGEPRGDDGVYNGAMDNALGVGMLLEMARFLAQTARPARSVLFVALAGEEAGLVGSDYFVHAPPVPAESLVANVNLEGLGLLFPVRRVMGVGARLSSLGDALRVAARSADLEVTDETGFAKTLFVRSDQYSFGRAGVPGIMPLAAPHSADPKMDGEKLQENWMAEVYHSPDDEDGPAIDYASAARLGETCARLVLRVADDRERPRWIKGSYLAEVLAGRAARGSQVQ